MVFMGSAQSLKKHWPVLLQYEIIKLHHLLLGSHQEAVDSLGFGR